MGFGFALLVIGSAVTIVGLVCSANAYRATRLEFAPEQPGFLRMAWNQLHGLWKRGGTQHAVAGTVASFSGMGTPHADVLPGPADPTLPLDERVVRLEDGLRNLARNTTADMRVLRKQVQETGASLDEAQRQIDQLGKDVLEGDRRVATSSLRAQSLGVLLVLVGTVLNVFGLIVQAVEDAL